MATKACNRNLAACACAQKRRVSRCFLQQRPPNIACCEGLGCSGSVVGKSLLHWACLFRLPAASFRGLPVGSGCAQATFAKHRILLSMTLCCASRACNGFCKQGLTYAAFCDFCCFRAFLRAQCLLGLPCVSAGSLTLSAYVVPSAGQPGLREPLEVLRRSGFKKVQRTSGNAMFGHTYVRTAESSPRPCGKPAKQ